MRIARIEEDKYQKMLVLAKKLQVKASEVQDPYLRQFTTEMGDLLLTMTEAYKPDDLQNSLLKAAIGLREAQKAYMADCGDALLSREVEFRTELLDVVIEGYKGKMSEHHKKEDYQYFLGVFADAIGYSGSPTMDEVLQRASEMATLTQNVARDYAVLTNSRELQVEARRVLGYREK